MESQTRLPAAVRRQVERAKRLQQQQAAASGEQAPEDATAQDKAQQAEQASQPVESKQESQSLPQDKEQEQQKQAAQQSTQTPAQTADPRENDPSYWKQRFNSTMGILRREREDRVAEEKRLNQEIAALRAEVAKLKAQESRSTIDLSEYFTAEQIEEIGEARAIELVEMARKVAESEVKRRVEQELEPIKQSQTHEQTVRQRRAVQAFHDALTGAVPNWQEINAMEDWLAFLGEEDEKTGLVRQEIIDMAQSRWDPRPVIALLKEFLAASGLSSTANQKPSVQPTASAATRFEPPTEEQEPERVPTMAEIKRMYTDLAMNRKITEKERMKRLAELDSMYKRAQRIGA